MKRMSIGMAPQVMKMMDMSRSKSKIMVSSPDVFAIGIFAAMFIWYLDLRLALFGLSIIFQI